MGGLKTKAQKVIQILNEVTKYYDMSKDTELDSMGIPKEDNYSKNRAFHDIQRSDVEKIKKDLATDPNELTRIERKIRLEQSKDYWRDKEFHAVNLLKRGEAAKHVYIDVVSKELENQLNIVRSGELTRPAKKNRGEIDWFEVEAVEASFWDGTGDFDVSTYRTPDEINILNELIYRIYLAVCREFSSSGNLYKYKAVLFYMLMEERFDQLLTGDYTLDKIDPGTYELVDRMLDQINNLDTNVTINQETGKREIVDHNYCFRSFNRFLEILKKNTGSIDKNIKNYLQSLLKSLSADIIYGTRKNESINERQDKITFSQSCKLAAKLMAGETLAKKKMYYALIVIIAINLKNETRPSKDLIKLYGNLSVPQYAKKIIKDLKSSQTKITLDSLVRIARHL